jgi:hypothetical protein
MEQQILIKKIPRYYRYIPFIGQDLAMARYPYIYLPAHLYARWTKKTMSVYDESVIIHETVHIHRQRQIGTWAYMAKYVLSKKFRLHEELVAIREQMTFLKNHGMKYDFERKARQFASYEYLWVAGFEESKMMLEGLWSEAKPN